MAIGINDLDDDDYGLDPKSGEEPKGIEEPSYQQHLNGDNDFVSDFLKTRGIDDITKIKFEDDNNLIVERDWNSLTNEEKINILNTPLETPQQPDNLLNDEEIQLLQAIRSSNLTPSQFIESIRNLEVAPQEPQYKIDDLSDDELFLLDLESRVGELSDELAAQALNNAKQNEELFTKQVEGIRKEYKEREDFLTLLQLAAYELEQLEAYNAFQDSIIDSISKFDTIGNLNLNFEDSDREELAEFMLSRDEAGNNYLWLALQDPDTMVKAAWFILNGEEALNDISEYFINLIKLVSLNQYKKGFEEGRNGKAPSRPEVVINKLKPNQRREYSSIEDLDDDD